MVGWGGGEQHSIDRVRAVFTGVRVYGGERTRGCWRRQAGGFRALQHKLPKISTNACSFFRLCVVFFFLVCYVWVEIKSREILGWKQTLQLESGADVPVKKPSVLISLS